MGIIFIIIINSFSFSKMSAESDNGSTDPVLDNIMMLKNNGEYLWFLIISVAVIYYYVLPKIQTYKDKRETEKKILKDKNDPELAERVRIARLNLQNKYREDAKEFEEKMKQKEKEKEEKRLQLKTDRVEYKGYNPLMGAGGGGGGGYRPSGSMRNIKKGG